MECRTSAPPTFCRCMRRCWAMRPSSSVTISSTRSVMSSKSVTPFASATTCASCRTWRRPTWTPVWLVATSSSGTTPKWRRALPKSLNVPSYRSAIRSRPPSFVWPLPLSSVSSVLSCSSVVPTSSTVPTNVTAVPKSDSRLSTPSTKERTGLWIARMWLSSLLSKTVLDLLCLGAVLLFCSWYIQLMGKLKTFFSTGYCWNEINVPYSRIFVIWIFERKGELEWLVDTIVRSIYMSRISIRMNVLKESRKIYFSLPSDGTYALASSAYQGLKKRSLVKISVHKTY